MGTKRPWEPPAWRVTPGDVGSLYYAGGVAARASEAVRGGRESPPRERDFLSQFGGGAEKGGGQGTRCRIRRHSPSLPLSLRLVGSEEQQQINREANDATILRGHDHGRHAPQQAQAVAGMVAMSPPLPPLPPPRQASVAGEPAGGYSTATTRLPRAASVAQTAPVPPTPRTPSAPAVNATQVITSDDLSARLRQPESWWFALARRSDGLGRDAWLSHHGLLAGKAVQRFSDAVAGPAICTNPASCSWTPPPGSPLQRICVDAGFTCPACRFRPPKVVAAPRSHLCLCWDCKYVFRDDPALACPVCAAVRAWGISA